MSARAARSPWVIIPSMAFALASAAESVTSTAMRRPFSLYITAQATLVYALVFALLYGIGAAVYRAIRRPQKGD